MKGFFGAAAVAAGLVLGLAPAAQSQSARTDVILAGSTSEVDYHAEAAPARPADGDATIIGGNIHIKTERGTRGGEAGACDPDPRSGTHPRPEDAGCEWAEPAGAGEDFIAFGRQVQNDLPDESGETPNDTDTSPNGAFDPTSTDTRERFNGRGGLDDAGALFMHERPVLDDEDLNFRIRGTQTFAYLSPKGDADNRWRRLCGEGVVEELSNNAPMAEPFAIGQVRPFVIQVWDADFKDPSDNDGGNQDYFIIDVFPEGTMFNVEDCSPVKPPKTPNPPSPSPGVTPSSPTPRAAPPAPRAAVQAAVARRLARGTARLGGVRACPIRAVPLRVQGRRIRRVTFFVDGRRIATVSRADAAGRFQVRVDPRRLRAGTHRVRAQVQFRSGAGPSRTLRMSFRVCARPARQVQPQFTG
ncbi:MAG TPA: hypothetical protein VHF51_06745 [Solirubrobacteraceae bacterium]|nr:hypothetical protein [Solirubrobacteraceae bacterium]